MVSIDHFSILIILIDILVTQNLHFDSIQPLEYQEALSMNPLVAQAGSATFQRWHITVRCGETLRSVTTNSVQSVMPRDTPVDQGMWWRGA